MKSLKSLLLALVPFSFIAGSTEASNSSKTVSPTEGPIKRVRRINQLAGSVLSVSQSRILVDSILQEFADVLPAQWRSSRLRDSLAEAEYLSNIAGQNLIPEFRVVNAWNNYVKAIGAPHAALISTVEFHGLRSGRNAASSFFWNRGNQSLWTIPNIYAVEPNGQLKIGCRAIESLILLWDLNNNFESLEAARHPLQSKLDVSPILPSTNGHIILQKNPSSMNMIRSSERSFILNRGAEKLQQERDMMIAYVLDPNIGSHHGDEE